MVDMILFWILPNSAFFPVYTMQVTETLQSFSIFFPKKMYVEIERLNVRVSSKAFN